MVIEQLFPFQVNTIIILNVRKSNFYTMVT
jgi:hypothetical protein